MESINHFKGLVHKGSLVLSLAPGYARTSTQGQVCALTFFRKSVVSALSLCKFNSVMCIEVQREDGMERSTFERQQMDMQVCLTVYTSCAWFFNTLVLT